LQVLDPVNELEAINKALQLCEDALRQGEAIDLTGVDEQVDMLCQEVVKTEGPMRLQLLPMLENAVSILDRLEQNLRQVALREKEQREAGRRTLAQSAYGGKLADGPQGTRVL